MSDSWHVAAREADFPEGGKLAVELGQWHALIVRDGGEYFAFNDCCTHQASKLSSGRVRRGTIMCPLHGARFEVKSGRCLGGGYASLRSFPVRIADGRIEVAVPDSAPGPGEKPLLNA